MAAQADGYEDLNESWKVGQLTSPEVKVAMRRREVRNTVGMRLIFIPSGTFFMGSPDNEPGREAGTVEQRHKVKLTLLPPVVPSG